jgi:hypothetical protein
MINLPSKQKDKRMLDIPYVWDYNIDKQTFLDILAGKKQIGRLDREWAILRLLEYAPYHEIIQHIGFGSLVQGWPQWRNKIRAKNRQRGFDFLVEWLPQNHPELLS